MVIVTVEESGSCGRNTVVKSGSCDIVRVNSCDRNCESKGDH